MDINTKENIRKKAEARVAFKIHLLVYVALNAFLWIVYALTWTGYPWPLWTMLALTIGLGVHYYVAYRSGGFLSVENEMNKLINANNRSKK